MSNFIKNFNLLCEYRKWIQIAMMVALSCNCTFSGAATTYYVSGSGNDSNSGLSTSLAFRTIQKAANLVNPGDIVYVMNGTYSNPPGAAVLNVTRSGTSTAWITYKAYPGHSPKMVFNYWWGIYFAGSASYVEINGFEIQGNNQNVTLSYCQNNGQADCNGNGISIDGRKSGANKPHHIRILNNRIHDCGGAGVSAIQSDYITIDNNTIYNTSLMSKYATSGISTYQNWRFDNNTGYKMFIRNNKVYNNYSQVIWSVCNCISDGNGIIIDDSKNTQNGSTLGAYTGRTLVQKNIVFNNGGSGIHSYQSEHVDIINNTAYLNARVLDYGSIYAYGSNDVKVMNNILYVRSGRTTNTQGSNSNVTYDYNIYYNGKTPVMGPHDIVADPKFVTASTDPALANFRLQSSSPAINSGTSTAAPTTDFDGKPRPSGSAFDRGAYEYQTTEIIIDNAAGSGVTITGSWLTSTSQAGYYRTNYLHDNNANKGSMSVRFIPNITSSGSYKVYAYWTAYSNRATNVPIDVVHSGGTTTYTVNQQLNHATWVLLGTHTFNTGTAGSVSIRTTGTNGYVIADAVRFVKQ